MDRLIDLKADTYRQNLQSSCFLASIAAKGGPCQSSNSSICSNLRTFQSTTTTDSSLLRTSFSDSFRVVKPRTSAHWVFVCLGVWVFLVVNKTSFWPKIFDGIKLQRKKSKQRFGLDSSQRWSNPSSKCVGTISLIQILSTRCKFSFNSLRTFLITLS